MKKILYLFFFLVPFVSKAQPGIISTVDSVNVNFWSIGGGGGSAFYPTVVVDDTGNIYTSQWGRAIYKMTPAGTVTHLAGLLGSYPGFSGDGGPATAAQIDLFIGLGKIAIDNSGNIYIADAHNNRIRKINTAGIINTIAGTGILASSGDGGPALSADIRQPLGIAVDGAGNIYFAETNRIRKINASGIISTIAGNGLPTETGDGGPATAASVGWVKDIALDASGNMFLLGPSSVRKINGAGIIQHVTNNIDAGGMVFYSPHTGDGGPAASATSNSIYDIDVDAAGNVYLACFNNWVIRKVNTSGIISTIGGVSGVIFTPGDCGLGGDGGLATLAQTCVPNCIAVHPSGDVYFAQDVGYTRLRKITYAPTLASDDLSAYVTKTCIGVDHYFKMNTYLPYHSVVTYYGDGTSSTGSLMNMGDGTGGIDVSHTYPTSGDYSIMHVLYNGPTPKDTISYTHHFRLCNNVYVRLYYDNNSNCNYEEATELSSHTAVTIRVDSNGVPIDTLSATSGFYYSAYGSASDVYTFRVLSASDSVHVSCPSSDILTKVLTPVVDDGATLYFALSCGTNPGFNLTGSSTANTGRHTQNVNILAGNKMCLPKNGTVTMNFSPKYNLYSSSPAPSSVVGHTATWNFTGMLATLPYKFIQVQLKTPGFVWLPPGDTVNTTIVIDPGTGDENPTDNVITRCDTVRYSWDPNDISVTPAGNILNGTELQYTVRFENDGNDTAHNIFILDTLSDKVDVSSLRVVAASAVMNTTIYRDGAYRIAKFDFPNIKLLDSSHHGLCDGMVIYTVKARTGLAHGTDIAARAGIYFDINPVVMTNTVHCTILIPSIAINTASGNSICKDSVTFTATSNSIKAPYYEWVVNGVIVGSNSATYLATGLTTGAVVKCILYNPGHDTVIATSNTMVMTVNSLPVAGTISAVTSTLCVGASTTLTASAPGGVWYPSNGNVSMAGDVVFGLVAGTTIVSYGVGNICGSALATFGMTVNPMPVAGTLSGLRDVCKGASISLLASAPGGVWLVNNDKATVAAGTVTAVSEGAAIVSYSVTNSCGTAMTWYGITIDPLPVAGVLTGPTEVYKGEVITMASSAPGGIWTVSTGSAINHNGMVVGQSAGESTVTYTVSNSCGSDMAYKTITVLEPTPPTLQPNPATNMLTVKANGEIYNSYAITNSSGKIVMEDHLTIPYTNINIRPLPAGVYYIKLVGNKGTVVRKFTKL